MSRVPVAVVGSGNVGTDLVRKLMASEVLEPVAVVGVDPGSDGLAKARGWGLETTTEGVEWLLDNAARLGVGLVFEATSASVHRSNAPRYVAAGLVCVDLTPAAIGPVVVPTVNIAEHLGAPNVNLTTCGGQATIPIVAAVASVASVAYAEIVSTISSRSAGPGTRANIDEFTRTTADGLADIGGAETAKAIIVLNPAEPPILMRNTVYCGLRAPADPKAVSRSVEDMAARIAAYVPGYRIKGIVYDDDPTLMPGRSIAGRITVLLEVSGNGDYLPPYAGNLDIMTASAMRVGEAMVEARTAPTPMRGS
jgi:acetaldehyde dehydrogenase